MTDESGEQEATAALAGEHDPTVVRSGQPDLGQPVEQLEAHERDDVARGGIDAHQVASFWTVVDHPHAPVAVREHRGLRVDRCEIGRLQQRGSPTRLELPRPHVGRLGRHGVDVAATQRELRDEHGKPIRLNDACALGLVHQQRVLDLDVEIEDGNGRKRAARVVCVPYDGEDHYYLTTLPREVFSPHDIAELYRVRWEVELFFRNWKGAVRLDQVKYLRNQTSLLVAITASVLAALLARDINVALERLAAEDAAEQVSAISP